MKADEYRQQLQRQEQQIQRGKFRALYPDAVWNQMSEVEQAQAWASWRQNDQLVAVSRTNLTWVWVVLGILGAISLLYVVSHALFY